MIPAVENHPSKLFVEMTTRCNLNCAMCVKQSGGGCIAEGDLSPRLFGALEGAFPRLEALLLSGIGEPLLHPDLDRFINRAKHLMPEGSRVGFQSNGFLIDDKRALSLVRAGVDRICISVDGARPDTFRAVRGRGDPGIPGGALYALAKAARAEGRNDFRSGIEFVAMKDNIDELPSVLEWGADHGIRFAIVTHLLPYDEAMVEHAAYDTSTDAALSFYLKWKVEAGKQGLDITRYYGVLRKYIRSEQEEKTARLVASMIADASQHGVPLHLKSLLARDERLAERTSAAFDGARRIACERGIDITLPEAVPRSVRRCDFVEEGSAFVSWDGRVHPCHFLWHRFRCFLGGVANNVRPFVFGDLGESSLLDIWNGPEFRAFRENVLRYDFPFCYDCGFALCDLVQEENFIEDCYLSKVPCAACLWCTQLFQCMR